MKRLLLTTGVIALLLVQPAHADNLITVAQDLQLNPGASFNFSANVSSCRHISFLSRLTPGEASGTIILFFSDDATSDPSALGAVNSVVGQIEAQRYGVLPGSPPPFNQPIIPVLGPRLGGTLLNNGGGAGAQKWSFKIWCVAF
jgi:hypothetical protein